MWVFSGGMFRSASTLQFQIAARLVQDADIGQKIGWIDADRFAETRDAYAHERGFKVVKVHVCTEPIRAEFLRNNALGIYISRDIRDVFSSYMKQRQKPFQFLWDEDFLATCLDNYQRWTSLPNMLVSTYQEVMADVAGEVDRIARHLRLTVDSEMCNTIAEDYNLTSQQKRIQQFREQLLQTPLNPNDHRDIVDYHDEETLLHMNHIDSARSDRWRDDLRPQEVALIEQGVEAWCDRNGYHPTLFLRHVTV